jgi:hypothetical protein
VANISAENAIRAIVRTAVETYATTFSERHIREIDDPDGTLNMKIHNVFIAVLGPEIQYYTALCRSFDSSLGYMLENMAINIALLYFRVNRNVQGPLKASQTGIIAELLEKYKRHEIKPTVKDYQVLRSNSVADKAPIKRHDSDYYLIDPENNNHYLIELKIGGDLDNKKARSEKEAILEQFAILSNTLPSNNVIKVFFATAYNRFGEGKPWKQERVRQFFADEELLIGKSFWDFICKSKKGYDIILDEYKKNSHFITNSLNKIKKEYLK